MIRVAPIRVRSPSTPPGSQMTPMRRRAAEHLRLPADRGPDRRRARHRRRPGELSPRPSAGLIVRYYPQAELDVVVLANSQSGAWDPIQEIHRRIAADNPRVGPSGL